MTNEKSMVIDLTQLLYDDCPNFPGAPKFITTPFCTYEQDDYITNNVCTYTHQGTHIDAKKHFYPDGYTIQQIPLTKCIGKAYKIDLTNKRKGSKIELTDLLTHKDFINKSAKIIIQTNWSELLHGQEYFMDFPSLSIEASLWLAKRQIDMLGMDMPSP